MSLHEGVREHPEPARAATPTSRYSTTYLDGLRGLAALAVFFQHYFAGFVILDLQTRGFGENGEYYLICNLPFLRLLWTGGHSAVAVFFVLSGYVLSIGPLSKLAAGGEEGRNKKAVQHGLAGALVRRPFRLYLPAWIITAVVALLLHVPGPLMLPYGDMGPKASFGEEFWNYITTAVKYYNIFQYHENDGVLLPYDVVVWTLPIELKGSLWVYGVVLVASFLLTSTYRRAAIFAGTLFVFAVAMLQMAFKWSGAAFSFGIVLAMIDVWGLDSRESNKTLAKIPERYRRIFYNVSFFLGWYLLCQPTSSFQSAANTPGWAWLSHLTPDTYHKRDGDHGRAPYYRYWATWGALLLIYGLLRLQWAQRFFASRPLRYLGKVSFMLYLVHIPWMRIALDRWHAALGGLDNFAGHPHLDWSDNWVWIPDWGPEGLNTRWLAALAFAVPTTLTVAEFATRYVDQPSIAFAERVATLVGLGRKKGGAENASSGPVLPS